MVSGDGEEVINNIWFVEWKKEDIPGDFKPASDRTVDLGNGTSIRVNYLLINGYERVYESLYQNTTTPMDALRDLQNNVYNLIKSKSISDLEVDMVNIHNFTDERALTRSIGFKPVEDNVQEKDEKISLLGVGTIADAEQLMTIYSMRISQVAEKLGLSYWYYVDQIIKRIFIETGFNLKDTNNRYHINIGIKQPEHRYSTEALQLFENILKKEEYFVVNENGEDISPRVKE